MKSCFSECYVNPNLKILFDSRIHDGFLIVSYMQSKVALRSIYNCSLDVDVAYFILTLFRCLLISYASCVVEVDGY